MDIEVDNIPDDLIIEAKLEVDLPQDMMQNANVAGMLAQSGMVSRRWARQHILNIGQSENMDKEIWDDQSAETQYQDLVRRMMEESLQREQMQKQQQMQAMGGGQQMPPPMQGAPQRQPGGPLMAGSAMNTQEGLLPAQEPGGQPVPPMDMGGM